MSRFAALFQPIKVGRLNLSHRITVPPHGAGNMVGSDREFEAYKSYYVARVTGGIDWVGGGPLYVANPLPPGFEPSGLGAYGPGLLRHPRFEKRFQTLMNEIHLAGGVGTAQLVLQGGKPLAPSQVPSGLMDWKIPHEVSRAEIQWIIDEYGHSARIATLAGADAIEIHANHDDIIQFFLSPRTNRRNDDYGGTPENRRRFLREIVEVIRGQVGSDVTLGLRLCLDELVEDGYGLDYCEYLIGKFTDEGLVDYFSVDVGNNWGSPSYIAPFTFNEGHWAELAGQVKRATHLPLVYVGRVSTPERAAEIVEQGQADLVGMVRANLADAEFVSKLKADRRDTIRPCVGANDCIHRIVVDGLRFGCASNPFAGHESRGPLKRASSARKILVVGGGPAGLEVAGLAAERGHQVQLWEQQNHLGGQLAAAARLRSNMAYQRWISWQIGRLERAGVDVMLNRTASLEAIAEHNPNVVVVATGAVARQPDVQGVARKNVFSSLLAIESSHLLGHRVAVIAEDDRSTPLAVADHLAGHGHHVTIFYPTVTPSSQVGTYSIGALLGQFDSAGGEIVTCRKLVAIHETSLEFRHSFSGRLEYREGFDSVVLATGSVSVAQLLEPLKGAGFETHILGDAYAPRRWTFATRQAFELAQIL